MHATLPEGHSFYERLMLPLVNLAVSQFHLSQHEAELLAYDIVMANLRHLETDDLATRLAAAMTIALHARKAQ